MNTKELHQSTIIEHSRRLGLACFFNSDGDKAIIRLPDAPIHQPADNEFHLGLVEAMGILNNALVDLEIARQDIASKVDYLADA